MSKTIIKLKNVTKTYKLFDNDKKRLLSFIFKNIKYNKKKAINNISFEIKKGETIAVLGRNGSGKTTLLKMITGITFPTSGEILVDGRVSALIAINAGFESEFTGRENIYLKCQLLGLKDNEIKKIENEIIEFSELEEYIDQPVRTYSTGMKARLGFAISISIKPEIFIVDETLSVGDNAFKKKCVQRVKQIVSNDEVTLIFVTHVTSVAKEFCNRGIVLEKGTMIFDGEIEKAVEIYDNTRKV